MPSRSSTRRRPVPAVVLAVVAVVLVVLVALLVVVLQGAPDRGDVGADPVVATGSPAAPVDQDTLGPVLLVPGYGGGLGGLQTLADALTGAGRDATVVDLGSNTGDLTVAAGTLGEAVDAALARTGATSVDVVGYSAGGIVTRWWIASGGATVTRRVVTLGSPHHGTTAVDPSSSDCLLACRQLVPGSELLAALNEGDETPSGPTWVSIWSQDDETVTPPETSRLAGALELPVQSVCADAVVSHESLPAEPLVHALVVAELAAGPPVELDRSDCDRLTG